MRKYPVVIWIQKIACVEEFYDVIIADLITVKALLSPLSNKPPSLLSPPFQAKVANKSPSLLRPPL